MGGPLPKMIKYVTGQKIRSKMQYSKFLLFETTRHISFIFRKNNIMI